MYDDAGGSGGRGSLGLYILCIEDGLIRERQVKDYRRWATWFGRSTMGKAWPTRIVARSNFGICLVSTVFLGINHAFMGGPPMLYETMVFGPKSIFCGRCSTYRQAAQQHRNALRKLPIILLREFWDRLRAWRNEK